MAGIAYVYIRLWNPGRKNIYGDTSNVLNYLERPYMDTGKNLRHFEILWIGATQAAAEELGTAPTSDKDGTTTPYQITLDSTDAKDTVAGVGARRVALIGVTVSSIGAFNAGETPMLTVEVVDMSGTTAVTSTRYYLWFIHGYVCDVGSEHDTAGTLTIESPAATTLYTITAGQNESEGCVLKFAAGDLARLDMVRIMPTVALAAADGAVLTVTSEAFEYTVQATDEDFEADAYAYINQGGSYCFDMRNAWSVGKLATLASKMLFQETLITLTSTIKIHATVLIGRIK